MLIRRPLLLQAVPLLRAAAIGKAAAVAKSVFDKVQSGHHQSFTAPGIGIPGTRSGGYADFLRRTGDALLMSLFGSMQGAETRGWRPDCLSVNGARRLIDRWPVRASDPLPR